MKQVAERRISCHAHFGMITLWERLSAAKNRGRMETGDMALMNFELEFQETAPRINYDPSERCDQLLRKVFTKSGLGSNFAQHYFLGLDRHFGN